MMFDKSRIRRWPDERGSYLELVISASWPEIELGREEILASALREVEMFFPAIRQATLTKSSVLKEARATFSVTPGLDPYRPHQVTNKRGLYLAGDWTATEWPSTMEGAVRSGRLAAGEVVGDRNRFMSPGASGHGSDALVQRHITGYRVSRTTPMQTKMAAIQRRLSTFSCRNILAAAAFPIKVSEALAERPATRLPCSA